MKNLFELIARKTDGWFSTEIGTVNDCCVSVRVMEQVEATFHCHEQSDEMFIVLDGAMFIDLENAVIALKKGESYTVAAGSIHRARVPQRAEMITIIRRQA